MRPTIIRTKDGTFEINEYGYVRQIPDEPEPSKAKPRNSEYRRIFLARQKRHESED